MRVVPVFALVLYGEDRGYDSCLELWPNLLRPGICETGFFLGICILQICSELVHFPHVVDNLVLALSHHRACRVWIRIANTGIAQVGISVPNLCWVVVHACEPEVRFSVHPDDQRCNTGD